MALPAGTRLGPYESATIGARCITVFDPDTIIDTATFEQDLSFSEGVHHVLVNGTFVVKDSQTVSGAYPGRPVVGRYKN